MTEKDFLFFKKFLLKEYGLGFPHYTRAQLRKFIGIRLKEEFNLRDEKAIGDYVARLKTLPPRHPAKTGLVDSLRFDFTQFFRHVDHLEYFEEQLKGGSLASVKGRPLRLWSAGCATGEEPFTLAMILDRYLGPKGSYEIFASDVNSRSLARGRMGLYPFRQVEKEVPQAYHSAFGALDQNHGNYLQISPRLQDRVTFKRINLSKGPFPKGPFDGIFCRNVLFYIDRDVVESILDVFAKAARTGAFLFLTKPDPLLRENGDWARVKPTIYRKV